MTKKERIEQERKSSGSRTHRKLKRYTPGFNEMFTFFLKCYRSDLLTFCGSKVETVFDPDEGDGKFCFRKYDNGEYKMMIPKTRHPNVLKGVITGKKSWGLWVQQWSDGIVDFSFTKEEILLEFEVRGIDIPGPLLRDFENVIERKKIIRNRKYLEQWKRTK